MNLLSAATLAAVAETRDKTYTAFNWLRRSTVRVPGKADAITTQEMGSINVRIAPINLEKNPTIALKFKDEPRVLFRVSLGGSELPQRQDFLQHPSLDTVYEILSVEEIPDGDAIVKYLIVAQVIE